MARDRLIYNMGDAVLGGVLGHHQFPQKLKLLGNGPNNVYQGI